MVLTALLEARTTALLSSRNLHVRTSSSEAMIDFFQSIRVLRLLRFVTLLIAIYGILAAAQGGPETSQPWIPSLGIPALTTISCLGIVSHSPPRLWSIWATMNMRDGRAILRIDLGFPLCRYAEVLLTFVEKVHVLGVYNVNKKD